MPLENSSSIMYRPVYQHWFYKREVDGKMFWQPFSMVDSMALESQFLSPDLTSETEVPTDGSRYNVNILRRQRSAVYWEESPSEVRRCSWYYKNHADSRYVPYDENVAARLEEEYKLCFTKNDWQGRVEFPNGEVVVFHSANAMAHYLTSTSPDAWGNTPVSPNMYTDGTQHRPRVVKRGVDEFDIESGESETVDHLLFLVHGIGSACDLKFRSVVEVVDDFRSVTQQLVESHFSASVESGKARRIEVLPVSWHEKLHSADIERQLKSITLPSIPLLRNLTNDTLIDILFYTSPIYCQTIINTVGKELNRLYELFLKRNPNFKGGVSLGGHSLGSLILFDLLWHQKGGSQPATPSNSPSTPPASDVGETIPENPEDTGKVTLSPMGPMKSKLSRKISYVMMGPAGTGQPFISYPQLTFSPENFFALGSPIGVFVTVRGIDKLGEDFKFPTCPAFFNIFHPYDLVAYRIETLIRSDMENVPPVLIPHHKGRKRMHLELKETVARMGADLKQRVLDSVRSTWNSVYQLASFHRNNDSLTEEMNKVLENEMMQQSMGECSNAAESESNMNIVVGKLNGGRRIDYVLQEAPFESFNGYLFSIGSHVCYWKSEDTMLLMLKEMYRSSGVNVDNQVPQQQINPPLGLLSSSSTSEALNTYSQVFSSSEPALLEPSPLFPTSSHSQQIIGMDPTAPPSDSRVAGPPPVSGFYRK